MTIAFKMEKHSCWPLIVKTLEAYGITDWQIIQTGKHPRLRFVYHGVLVRYTLPNKTTGRGTRVNIAANLRRKLHDMNNEKKVARAS